MSDEQPDSDIHGEWHTNANFKLGMDIASLEISLENAVVELKRERALTDEVAKERDQLKSWKESVLAEVGPEPEFPPAVSSDLPIFSIDTVQAYLDKLVPILEHRKHRAEHLAAKLVEAQSCEVVMRAALEEAKTGLEWYHANHPEPVDGSDDEAMERINAALAGQPAPKPQGDELDAKRYRRLRILGCAPMGSPLLRAGLVMRFQSMDKFIDGDIASYASRGEAPPAPKSDEPTASQWPEYTNAIGEAGEAYLKSVSLDGAARLPGTFRFYELWDAMNRAAQKLPGELHEAG